MLSVALNSGIFYPPPPPQARKGVWDHIPYKSLEEERSGCSVAHSLEGGRRNFQPPPSLSPTLLFYLYHMVGFLAPLQGY